MCGTLRHSTNWKCFLLTLLILACLTAIAWCRLTQVMNDLTPAYLPTCLSAYLLLTCLPTCLPLPCLTFFFLVCSVFFLMFFLFMYLFSLSISLPGSLFCLFFYIFIYLSIDLCIFVCFLPGCLLLSSSLL